MRNFLEPLLGKASKLYQELEQAVARHGATFVCVLLDCRLLELPIEMLDICQLFPGGVSRDLSVQTLSQRCLSGTEPCIHASAMRAVIDPFGEDGAASQALFASTIGSVTTDIAGPHVHCHFL